MISEEEKERLSECEHCDGCLSWHKHCNAECCKIIYLGITPSEAKRRGPYITIPVPRGLSKDEIWYYRLRDVICTRSSLKFKRERIIELHGEVLYIHPCKALTGNKCNGHPHDKPKVCKALSMKTYKLDDPRFRITNNCLFKYKRWLDDVKRKSD